LTALEDNNLYSPYWAQLQSHQHDALLYHHMAQLTEFYRKSTGELMCAGLDGLAQASSEKAIKSCTHHLFIQCTHTLTFIEYLQENFQNFPKILSMKMVVMIKDLVTELGWAKQENIWFSVIAHGPHCARSIRHDFKTNIFPSGPLTESIST